MKKVLLMAALLLAALSGWCTQNYQISAVAPSGQTLYYQLIDGHAKIVTPNVEILSSGGWRCNWDGYTKPTGALVIPSSVNYSGYNYPVMSIGRSAFYACDELTSVSIPNTIDSIEDFAFGHCTGLTSIIIPSSVSSISINPFCYCDGLISVTVSSGNTSYDSRDNCNAVIKTSTNELIVGCNNTIIPSSITQISAYAFANCFGLTSVTIPNTVTNIENYAFDGCGGLTSITIPNSVTFIGHGAFRGCHGLTSINIPSSVNYIYGEAFANCNNLITAVIGNNMIGNNEFKNCYKLKNVTISNTVTSIGESAFEQCYNLPSISIPNSVTEIGSGAFAYCTSLNTVNIPNSVISIGGSAFAYVNNISYTGSATGSPWGAKNVNGYVEGGFVYSDQAKTKVTGYVGNDSIITIPNTVAEIGQNAFFGSVRLTSVTIPISVVTIGSASFASCFGLSNLSMPTSFNNVGNNAFYNCINLTSVNNLIAATNNPTMGYARITFPNTWNSIVYFSATPFEGYSFVDWSDGYNEDTRIFPITASGTYTANFTIENSNQYNITVTSSDPTMGTVSGGGTYNAGATATLTATANSGYHFVRWSDNNTQNPRNITVNSNITLTAYFAANAGIDDIDDAGFSVYAKDYQIYIDEAFSEEISVYTIDGRTIASLPKAMEHVAIPVPTTGVYIVKVGNYPARKVVVIR